MTEKGTIKKIGSLIGVGVLVGGSLGFTAGAMIVPTEVIKKSVTNPVNDELATQNQQLMDKVQVLQKNLSEKPEVVKDVVYKNRTVEVPVDNGNLDSVLKEVYDQDGNVEFLIDDLEDDEIDKIVDRVEFVNTIREKAIDTVKDTAFSELDRVDVDGVELDDRDMSRLDVEQDVNNITVEDIDFEDGEGKVTVPVEFEHDHQKHKAKFMVEFYDGQPDEITLVNVQKE